MKLFGLILNNDFRGINWLTTIQERKEISLLMEIGNYILVMGYQKIMPSSDIWGSQSLRISSKMAFAWQEQIFSQEKIPLKENIPSKYMELRNMYLQGEMAK